MKQLKLRFGRPEDSKEIIEWINSNPENEFDPSILKYPTLRVLCSYSEEESIVYVPTQNVVMLESTAINPNARNLEVAQALKDCVKAVTLTASSQGMREIYFLATDKKVEEFAENNGFEKLPWPVMRMRL